MLLCIISINSSSSASREALLPHHGHYRGQGGLNVLPNETQDTGDDAGGTHIRVTFTLKQSFSVLELWMFGQAMNYGS